MTIRVWRVRTEPDFATGYTSMWTTSEFRPILRQAKDSLLTDLWSGFAPVATVDAGSACG